MKDATQLAMWLGALAVVSGGMTISFFSEGSKNSGYVLLVITILFIIAAVSFLCRSFTGKP